MFPTNLVLKAPKSNLYGREAPWKVTGLKLNLYSIQFLLSLTD